MRIMNAEPGLLDTAEAMDLFMDAAVVLADLAMDRVSRESRYLTTRLAMLRQAVADGIITLRKIDTKTNPADIFTKPLFGETPRRRAPRQGAGALGKRPLGRGAFFDIFS